MLTEQLRAAIRAKNHDELCQWLRELIPRQANGNAAVCEVVAAIGAELRTRARTGETAAGTTGEGMFAGSPEIGMLKTLGYSVGDTQPVLRGARQLILQYAIEGHLPVVGGRAHRNEWGEPHTKQRFQKLVNTLWSLLNNPAHRNHERARREWEEDLDWLAVAYTELGAVPITL
jgi:hypothetical protein